MFPPRFDIYTIYTEVPARNAKWIETADAFNAAQRRMKALAEEKSGRYFIFSSEAKKVIAWLDTTAPSSNVHR
jgi:hypothetical protein